MEKQKHPQPPWPNIRCEQDPDKKDDELLYNAIENMVEKGQPIEKEVPKTCHL